MEGCKDLAGTDNDTLAFRWGSNSTSFVFRIAKDPVEVGFAGEFRKVGASKRMAEEGFGEEEDEC